MIRSLASCLVIALVSSACAKTPGQGSEGGSTSGSQYTFTSSSTEEIVQELEDASLFCNGICEPSIGMIGSIIDKDDAKGTRHQGQCTGFLVSDSIVATNAHCVQGLPLTAGDCSHYLAIKFPATDNRAQEVFACKRILSVSAPEDTPNTQDYAFFAIAPSHRTPLRLSRSGIADRSFLRILRITPNRRKGFGGEFQSSSCVSTQNSLLNMAYTSNWSATALATGCDVVRGNSGSPVFNGQNEVVGIAQSRKTADFLKAMKQQLGSRAQDFSTEPPAHTVLTNLSCVAEPFLGDSNAAFCGETKKGFLPRSTQDSDTLKEMQVRVAAWESELPSFLRFTIAESEGSSGSVFTATPFCLATNKGWDRDLRVTKADKRYWVQFNDALRIGLKLAFDANLRILTNLAVDSQKIPSQLRVDFVSRDQIGAAFSDTQGTIALHICTPAEAAAGNITLGH